MPDSYAVQAIQAVLNSRKVYPNSSDCHVRDGEKEIINGWK